jgi:hypothetical protein
MSKYYNLSQDSINLFNQIFDTKAFPLGINFAFIGHLLQNELLVCMNEELLTKFDQESITILIEQELDKISINLDTGKIKFVKPNLSTFTSLISKYGLEKVGRANQIEDLYNEQQLDSEQGFVEQKKPHYGKRK